ncbi:MAG TPA: proline dehydrogenase [Saprospirales bacterium]|nr:proline dehydrogenase [Saprospirales bacterium]HRQ28604.1 proline dehydrogenase family protein [Saprospiraceae bacterium]
MDPLKLNNTEIAFAYKSNRELRESYWLFKLMNHASLVKLGTNMAMTALNWHLPIKGIVKRTIYRQFCGGETIEECNRLIKKLGEFNIKTILDYGVEAKSNEEEFDKSAEYLIKTLHYAIQDDNIHIISSKLTGLFRSALLEKMTAGASLTEAEQQEYERGKKRIWNICEAANRANIYVHIDAEESWLQGAIDELALELSAEFNKGVPTVINALQMYRKDRIDFLKRSLEHAREHKYLCAVKLVRGAYMEKERARAAAKGYPSPIFETIEGTHASYNAGLEYCLDHIDEMYLSNATHNEDSCQLLAKLMDEKDIPKNHPRIVTAQLIGMSDNISFGMAKAGYNVEKYVPYGPVKHVLPYLIRRTQENTSVGGQMSREFNLIQTEMRRRKLI